MWYHQSQWQYMRYHQSKRILNFSPHPFHPICILIYIHFLSLLLFFPLLVALRSCYTLIYNRAATKKTPLSISLHQWLSIQQLLYTHVEFRSFFNLSLHIAAKCDPREEKIKDQQARNAHRIKMLSRTVCIPASMYLSSFEAKSIFLTSLSSSDKGSGPSGALNKNPHHVVSNCDRVTNPGDS